MRGSIRVFVIATMNRRAAACVMAALIVVLAPLFAPDDPLRTDPANALQAAGGDHVLGTDLLGRDVLSRALYGGQRSIIVALLAAVGGFGVGAALSLGRSGSPSLVNSAIETLINALLAFPGVALSLIVLTLLGTGVLPIVIATGAAQIAPTAVVIRAAVIQVQGEDYLLAARAMGASRWRIVARHVLPNIAPILVAYFGVTFGYCLLNSGALNFLGLSGDLSAPDWGGMLQEGRLAFRSAPWIAFVPGIGITLTLFFVAWLLKDTRPNRRG